MKKGTVLIKSVNDQAVPFFSSKMFLLNNIALYLHSKMYLRYDYIQK